MTALEAIQAIFKGIKRDVAEKKQDILTFDSIPTSGSTNPVISGGVYNAIQGVESSQNVLTSVVNSNVSRIGNLETEITKKIPLSQKGAVNGVAELDSNGLVPATQLPSYVDDVLEGTAVGVTETSAGTYAATGFILRGESIQTILEEGKTYVDILSNIQYRWTGVETNLVSMGSNLTLGETASTAFPGNKGKQNADDIEALQTGKQDVLTFDSTPASGSTNPVTSGGVYTALQGVESSQNVLVSAIRVNTSNIEELQGYFDKDSDDNISLHNNEAGFTVGSRATNTAIGPMSFASGNGSTASGAGSVAFGMSNTASGLASFVHGTSNTASVQGAHAEGTSNTASGLNSHAEGAGVTASGNSSHAEGEGTKAMAQGSHAEGLGTIAGYPYQHVAGQYNQNVSGTSFEVGNGIMNGSEITRSNAFEVYKDGTINAAGAIKQGGVTVLNDQRRLLAQYSEMSGHPAIWYNGQLDYSGMDTVTLEAIYNSLKDIHEDVATKADIEDAIGQALTTSY